MIEPEQIMLLTFRAIDRATGQKSTIFLSESQAKRVATAMPWGEIETISTPVDQALKETDLMKDWAQ